MTTPATQSLINAAEQFRAAFKDGNVGTPEMLAYFDGVFEEALAAVPRQPTELKESGPTGTDGSQKPNGADAIRSTKAGSIQSGGDPAEPRDDTDRSHRKPIGYVAANELSRLHSGHDASLRSARFGPSALDGDIPVYIEQPTKAGGNSFQRASGKEANAATGEG